MNSVLRLKRTGGGVALIPFDRIDFVSNAYEKKDEGTTAERFDIVPGVSIIVLIGGRELSVDTDIEEIWGKLNEANDW